jgi:hypothetical protein
VRVWIGLAAIGLAVLLVMGGCAAHTGTRVEVACGPTVTTPGAIQGLDATAKAGDLYHQIATASPDEMDHLSLRWIRFLLDVKATIRVWKDNLLGHANGRGEPTAATGWRREVERNQAAALASCCPAPGEAPDEQGEWDPKQASYSGERQQLTAAAVQVAAGLGLPPKAAVVAVTAGLVESGMRNLDYGDRDSLGVLQQRPSAGWGTARQVQTPRYAFTRFYRALVQVPDWQSRPVGEVAQAVQRSAFPARYAGRVGEARQLVAGVGAAAPELSAADCAPPATGPAGQTETPAGWDFPGQRSVDGAIAWMARMEATNGRDPRGGTWYRKCLGDVGMAYGHPTTAANWAINQFYVTPERYRVEGRQDPPRGALVYWRTGGPGHVALSNGDGRVWTNDAPGRKGLITLTDISIIDRWGPRVGYTAPMFPGGTTA